MKEKSPRIRALILDLDGVVYLGPRLIPGAKRALTEMARRGVRVLYATNNATMTRNQFARKLRRLGLPCPDNAVMNASLATALFLRARHGTGARVVVVGEHGLPRELRAVGLRPCEARTRAEWERFRGGRSGVRAVVVSFDRTLSYWKLCAALDALNAGAELVACNLDPTYPAGPDLLMPGTGSLVALLERASGKRPLVVGKPDPAMFRLLLREHGIAPRNALVIGDRLESDIEAGRRLGAPTAVVLTGLTSRALLGRSRMKPDHVLGRLPDLLKLDIFAPAGRA